MPDAVDKVVCAHDDGWWYHPKHVEQFADKINYVMLHLVGCILEYSVRLFTVRDVVVIPEFPTLVRNQYCFRY
jgi:hypothetical protein